MDSFRQRAKLGDESPGTPNVVVLSSPSLKTPLPPETKQRPRGTCASKLSSPVALLQIGCATIAIGVLLFQLEKGPFQAENTGVRGRLRFSATEATAADVASTVPTAPEPPAFTLPSVAAAPVVCILGNAQTVALAKEQSAFWPTYHSFWAIWGEPLSANLTVPTWEAAYANHGSVVSSAPTVFRPFPCPKGACPWTVGMKMALQTARDSGVPCEYYFTSDDDCDWKLMSGAVNEDGKLEPKAVGSSVAEELTQQLRRWRPAVASFPWEYADKTFPGATAAAQLAGFNPVSPLMSFDNGNALYHASIVDLIMPFSPAGEGGFEGNWTLPASWLNVVVPFAFQANAIRINTIRYVNKLNMNNGAEVLGHKPKTKIENGAFYTEAARHPYEFPRRKAYETFLSGGIVPLANSTMSSINGNQSYRWGQHMFPSDITWKVEVGYPPYSPATVVAQFATRYNPEHVAVATAFKRWGRQSAAQPRYRVVALLSSNSPTQLQTVLGNLLFPVSSRLDSRLGFLSVSKVVPSTVTALSITTPTAEEKQQWTKVAAEIDNFVGATVPTVVTSLPPCNTTSVLDVLKLIWPATETNPDSEALVLLRQGRLVGRNPFHWANACWREFHAWGGVQGCSLSEWSAVSSVAPLKTWTVQSKKPFMRMFAGPDNNDDTTSTSTFTVRGVDWMDGPGIVVFRWAWTDMLERIAASGCQDNVAQLSQALGEVDRSQVYVAFWTLLKDCLPNLPRGTLVYPAQLP